MPNPEERLQALEQKHVQLKKLEERLQALEQEHTQLKKITELQTIVIKALADKDPLEKLNEKYNRIFEVSIAHDLLTSE